MREWWINDIGQNTLKGVEEDSTNPIVLPDETVLHFLRRIPASRDSFERLVPTMLPDERTRLEALALNAPMIVDEKDVSDQFQRRLNSQGLFTTGPRGGTRRGGNR